MTSSDITSRVQEVFRKVLKDPDVVVHDTMSADDHDAWDSLSHIHLIMEIENAFSIRLKNSEVARLRNVGDLLGLVAKKTS